MGGAGRLEQGALAAAGGARGRPLHSAGGQPYFRLQVFATPLSPLPEQATPMGLRAKTGVRARNTVLLLGFAMLVAGNLCFAFLPSVLGERGLWGGAEKHDSLQWWDGCGESHGGP